MLAERVAIETRTLGGVPWQPWRNPYWRFNIGGPIHPAREVQGFDTVLGLHAVYACVRYIADQIARMPILVYRQLPNGHNVRLPNTQLFGNLANGDGPSVYGTTYDWVFSMLSSCLLWGNSWGLITGRSGVAGPNGLGLPTGIEWLPPDRMNVQDDEQQPENPLRANIYYQGKLMDRSELVHMRAFVVPGRLEAISPLRAFAILWAQGLDALKYSADWFHNGGFPPGTFQNTQEEVDDSQARMIRQRLTDTLRQREPLVYGKDWDYKPIVVPPNEAAFIQAMQLNSSQVASIYGVPPQKAGGALNDTMHYTSELSEAISILKETLHPWMTRAEHILSSMLPATQFARFDYRVMLKADPKTQAEIEQIERTIGKRTINEIRYDDDLPEIAGGNDGIPLGVMERMIATTRLVPKSIRPQVDFEQDHILQLLEQMTAQGLIPPPQPGMPAAGTMTAPQYLGRQIEMSRALMSVTDPDVPLTEADRQTAKTLLKAQLDLGNLDHGDYVGRLNAAGKAETIGALQALFSGLPEPTGGKRGASEVPGWAEPGQAEHRIFGAPHIRASNDDRLRAHDLLGQHAAAGRLTSDELAERRSKVSAAKLIADLDEQFADLPVIAETAEPAEGPTPPLFGPLALAELRSRWEPPSLNGNGYHKVSA